MAAYTKITLPDCMPCRLRLYESYNGIVRKTEDFYSENPDEAVRHHYDMLVKGQLNKRIQERIDQENRTRKLTKQDEQRIATQVEREFQNPYKLRRFRNPKDKREFAEAEISYGKYKLRYVNLNPSHSMPFTQQKDIYVTFEHVVIKVHRNLWNDTPEQLAQQLNAHYAGYYGKAYTVGTKNKTVKGKFSASRGNKSFAIESKYVQNQLQYIITERTDETITEHYPDERPQRLRTAISTKWKEMGYTGKLRYSLNPQGEPIFEGGFMKRISSTKTTPQTLILLIYYNPLQNNSKNIRGWSIDYMENYIEHAENNTGIFRPTRKGAAVRSILQDEDKYNPEWKPRTTSEHTKTDRLQRQYNLQMAELDDIKRQQNELDARKTLLYKNLNK